jgi:hypothetical protein
MEFRLYRYISVRWEIYFFYSPTYVNDTVR